MSDHTLRARFPIGSTHFFVSVERNVPMLHAYTVVHVGDVVSVTSGVLVQEMRPNGLMVTVNDKPMLYTTVRDPEELYPTPRAALEARISKMAPYWAERYREEWGKVILGSVLGDDDGLEVSE